ncbi:MAG: SDR family oxidoreductase [Pseudomonadota bacterium]
MLLITGATGKVGRAAGKALSESGIPFRVLVRDPQRLSLPPSESIQVAVGDLSSPKTLETALEGVNCALLVTGNSESQEVQERNFIDAAASCGVSRVVKISSMEASPTTTAVLPKLHYDIEQHTKASGMAWTFLQPNFFMQNLLMYAEPIGKAGVFALPFGNAKAALIDVKDIGAVCAKVLQEEGHDNATYQLTGSTLQSFHDVAACFSDCLGKEVKYIPQSAEEFRGVLSNFIHSTWHLDALCELFAQIEAGALENTTDHVKQLLGHSPRSLKDFIVDHKAVFEG